MTCPEARQNPSEGLKPSHICTWKGVAFFLLACLAHKVCLGRLDESWQAGPTIAQPVEVAVEREKKSSYLKFKELFETGTTVPLRSFSIPAVMLGRCMTREVPDRPIQATLNIFPIKNPVLGDLIYTIPYLEEKADVEHMEARTDRVVEAYEKARKEIRFFTSLHVLDPDQRGTPWGDKVTGRDLFFTKDSEGRRVLSKAVTAGIDFFRIRQNVSELNRAMVVEKLCSSFTGCGCRTKGCKERVHFGQPFIYCVFSDYTTMH